VLDTDEHPHLYLDLRVKPSHFPTSIEVRGHIRLHYMRWEKMFYWLSIVGLIAYPHASALSCYDLLCSSVSGVCEAQCASYICHALTPHRIVP
jgi:hypothetical protein